MRNCTWLLNPREDSTIIFCFTGFDGPIFTSYGPAGDLFDMPIKFRSTTKQENGFSVFISPAGFFLFAIELDGELIWAIGTDIGDASKIIIKSTDTPAQTIIPSVGWLYFDSEEWKIDVTLISVTIPTGGIKLVFEKSLINI